MGSLTAQEIPHLTPSEKISLDFSEKAHQDWEKRTALIKQIEEEGLDFFQTLSPVQQQLLETYPETYSSIWDVEGGGCSFYCGAGAYEVKASSFLQNQGKNTYNGKMLFDFNYETAWVEGMEGTGEGENIVFTFAPEHPRLTEVIITNGYVKSKKAYTANARVKTMKMYVDGAVYAVLQLDDFYGDQKFELPTQLGRSDREDMDALRSQPSWNITFEIIETYPGTKYQDTAITELRFNGIDVH